MLNLILAQILVIFQLTSPSVYAGGATSGGSGSTQAQCVEKVNIAFFGTAGYFKSYTSTDYNLEHVQALENFCMLTHEQAHCIEVKLTESRSECNLLGIVGACLAISDSL